MVPEYGVLERFQNTRKKVVLTIIITGSKKLHVCVCVCVRVCVRVRGRVFVARYTGTVTKRQLQTEKGKQKHSYPQS